MSTINLTLVSGRPISVFLTPWVSRDMTHFKVFLRTFIKRIKIRGDEAIIRYALPMSPQGKTNGKISVLPIDTPSGLFGTVPELLFERKQLIPALQQLLVSKQQN